MRSRFGSRREFHTGAPDDSDDVHYDLMDDELEVCTAADNDNPELQERVDGAP
jgi:hypothetical protein